MNDVRPLEQEAGLAVPLIALENVAKTFVTEGAVTVEALRDVSLAIYPGEFVAVMGASGSGKSTLMNVIGCLDRPTRGHYRFAGRNVAQLDRDALARLRREAFGFIFQSYNLIGTASATENVEVPALYAGVAPTARRSRAEELLAQLGLGDRLTHRPNQLSGGQQQRVSVARALMNGGRIILADEPTGALDSKSGAEVMALLRDLARRGHTVVLITHDKEVAAHADRLIEIKDGTIVRDSGRSRSAARALPEELKALAEGEHEEAPSALADAGEALRTALRALRVNIFRTVLTLLGIVIGVGSVVAMLAVGEGARQAVLDQIGSMGTNLLLVRPGAPNQRGFGGSIATLMPEDATAIAALPNVQSVIPEIQGSVTARIGDKDDQTQADGTTANLPETRSWPVARGTFFAPEDAKSYAAVAVLGQTVVTSLFPEGGEPIGQYVLLNNVPFQVIGVMSAKGASAAGFDTDDVIFVPLSTGSLRLFGQRYLRSITVAVSDLSAIDATQDAVTALLKSRHNNIEDFRIRNMMEVMQTASAAQDTLTVLLGSIAAISLLVGGIGVMNIMLVSVTERTREIGIRMATGARMRDILEQFLTEATVVSGLGGVIGIVCGLAVGGAIAAFGMPVHFSVLPLLLAFGCAAATGIAFGFAPALKAARLDPVVALSSE
jgi:macrolide transport system ATP-binding/permease protein